MKGKILIGDARDKMIQNKVALKNIFINIGGIDYGKVYLPYLW